MKVYNIATVENMNHGDACEYALCKHYNVNRESHDHSSYNKNSDIVVNDKNISVKSDGFTLMSGSLCKGLNTFGEIWNLFEQTTHSNVFAYVTKSFTVYEMDINEFKLFMFIFGRVERESKKMERWLKCHL